MRLRLSQLVLAVAGGAALVAAACGPGSDPSPTATPRTGTTPSPGGTPGAGGAERSVSGIPIDPNGRFGGVLIAASTEEGPSTSPWEEAAGVPPYVVHPQTNMLIQHQTWGALQGANIEDYWTLHPDLATDWEQSADGMTWTFNLRDGVEWADGEPFTCDDTKWTFDSIRTGEGLLRSPRSIHFTAIDEIVCTDDLTMVVNMRVPKASLPDMMALPYNSVLPQHIFGDGSDRIRSDPYKLGTGPFLLVDWVPGESYRLERKDDYWDQPFPFLDAIEVPIIPASSTVTALRGGRLDFSGGFTGGQADTLIRECTVCQFGEQYIHPGFGVVMINTQRAPWNTPEIMTAIAYSVDKQKSVDVGVQGWGEPGLGGLFPSSSFWALPYERTRLLPGHDIEDPEGNIAKAQALLAQAGYAPGELRLDLTIWNNVTTVARSVPVIEDLTRVGFNVQPMTLETARAYDAMTAGNFSVHMHGFFVSDGDPDLVLYEHYYPGSDRNYQKYNNPEVVRLIDEQSQTTDLELRRERVWDLQEILLREGGKVITEWGAYQPIWSNKVHGIAPGPHASWHYGSVRRHAQTWLMP